MSTKKQTLSINRHIMAALTFIVLVPLVYYIPPWIMRNITDDHFSVIVLALAIIVPIVSYVALPLLFKLFEILNKKITWKLKNKSIASFKCDSYFESD